MRERDGRRFGLSDVELAGVSCPACTARDGMQVAGGYDHDCAACRRRRQLGHVTPDLLRDGAWVDRLRERLDGCHDPLERLRLGAQAIFARLDELDVAARELTFTAGDPSVLGLEIDGLSVSRRSVLDSDDEHFTPWLASLQIADALRELPCGQLSGRWGRAGLRRDGLLSG